MPGLRVQCFAISLEGYGAGPAQSLENPLGVGGVALHEWFRTTRTFQKMLFGKEGGTTGPDDDFAARGIANIGGWILGRNMFGPVRGPWPDESWKGWWGDNPPYHVPVFVLTHHPRASITMAGGTTFHFVTEGIEAALKRATEAAGGKDIRLGGGVATIREYLKAPPSKSEVEGLLNMVGGDPTMLIRDGEVEFKTLKKKKAELTKADIVKAIAAHPVLLQRPIVVSGKRAAIGRPPEAVLPLLK